MLERDWLEMGSTTVTVYHALGLTGYGAPLLSTGTKVDAIVHANRRNIIMPDGRVEQQQTLLFILSTSMRVGNQDQIMMQDSTTPGRLLAVDHTDDEDGQHHVEVSLG